MKRYNLNVLVSVSFALYFSGVMHAQKLDRLIEELEEQLLPLNSEKEQGPVNNDLIRSSSKIEASDPFDPEFKKVELKMDQIEKELEEIGFIISKQQETISQKSALSNFFEVKVLVPEKVRIKDLHITINNSLLLEKDRIMPVSGREQVVKVYQGPLFPGKYRLDFHGRSSDVSSDKTKASWQLFNKSVYFNVNQLEQTQSIELKVARKKKFRNEFELISQIKDIDAKG